MKKILSDIWEGICILGPIAAVIILFIWGIYALTKAEEQEQKYKEDHAINGVFYGDWVGYSGDQSSIETSGHWYIAIIRVDTTNDGKEDIVATMGVPKYFHQSHEIHHIKVCWYNNQWEVLQVDNQNFNE